MKMSSIQKTEASKRIWAFKNCYITMKRKERSNKPAFPCQINTKLAKKNHRLLFIDY